MNPSLRAALAEALGAVPQNVTALSGGCISEVWRVELSDHRKVVVKHGPATDLATEAWMLAYLSNNSALPVPAIYACRAGMLAMEYIEADGGPISEGVQEHAAELLGALHAVTRERFGLERDTLIGSLPQPNPEHDSWPSFFAETRLCGTARIAFERGGLNSSQLAHIEKLAGKVDRWIDDTTPASLIHGDMWGGNVLVRDGRVAGFVDPAVYYADPEIELAFSTLFGTFGPAFFRRYEEVRGMRPGFFEVRRDLYNVYPLLVHAALFDGGYGASADAVAVRLAGS